MERFESFSLIANQTALCCKSQHSRLKYQLKNYRKRSLDSQIVLARKWAVVLDGTNEDSAVFNSSAVRFTFLDLFDLN